MTHKFVYLLESSFVQQQLHTLSRRKFPFLMLPLLPLGPTALQGRPMPTIHFFHTIL